VPVPDIPVGQAVMRLREVGLELNQRLDVYPGEWPDRQLGRAAEEVLALRDERVEVELRAALALASSNPTAAAERPADPGATLRTALQRQSATRERVLAGPGSTGAERRAFMGAVALSYAARLDVDAARRALAQQIATDPASYLNAAVAQLREARAGLSAGDLPLRPVAEADIGAGVFIAETALSRLQTRPLWTMRHREDTDLLNDMRALYARQVGVDVDPLTALARADGRPVRLLAADLGGDVAATLPAGT
jgi:hypothetical protein